MPGNLLSLTLQQTQSLVAFLEPKLKSVDEVAAEVGREHAFRLFTLLDRCNALIAKQTPATDEPE